jgi:hypothetical protein
MNITEREWKSIGQNDSELSSTLCLPIQPPIKEPMTHLSKL